MKRRGGCDFKGGQPWPHWAQEVRLSHVGMCGRTSEQREEQLVPGPGGGTEG